ncbi:hypothetical protein PMIT1306_02552 [Prochlorococcus sp. MIT 1306]|nr:hypothetical protein PMIT1306_02552 [Prochlorococcus sp. MIT 1306]
MSCDLICPILNSKSERILEGISLHVIIVGIFVAISADYP